MRFKILLVLAAIFLCCSIESRAQGYNYYTPEMHRPTAYSICMRPYNAPFAATCPYFIIVDTNGKFALSTNIASAFTTGTALQVGAITTGVASGTTGLTNFGDTVLPALAISNTPLCILTGSKLNQCPSTSVTTIDGNPGAFTFAGPCVSHVSLAYTFNCPAGSGVTSLNLKVGAVTITAGPGISITNPSGNNLLITNTAGGGSGITPVTFSLPTATITANACTAATPVAMVGMLTTSSISWTFASDPGAVTGWGGSGGLRFVTWPTADTLNWRVCNETGLSVTPGAMDVNVGASN